ncbi:MAG TPA: hypothetical protein VFE34_02630 [Dongiaceae bacterium]|jgi:hypothetical protein|nr:hypothetical protein [Dongiaceae bacterium]
MWFSAEFQRNLWLQLSWGRVLAAPVLFGILVAALVQAVAPAPGHMAEFARWGFVLLLAFWSTRRVADALAEEVGGGTWESQRMSGTSAWSMVWGKLAGGAVFPWYCALICLGVMVWYGMQAPIGEMRVPLWQQVATLLLGAVLGQATSLTVALLLLRKVQFRRRLTVTLAQIAGLLAFGLAVGWDYSANPWSAGVGIIRWYDQDYDSYRFYLASAGVFTAWALLAAWRLMRAELLYVNRPWVWTLFTLFGMAYAAGFVKWEIEALSSRLAIACVSGLVLTYAAFFGEVKDPVRYRWGLARFKALQWWRALEFMPWWLISYIFAAIAGAGTIWSIAMGGQLTWQDSWWFTLQRDANWMALSSIAYNIVALLLFVLRDMFFLLWLNFGTVRNRADLSGLVVLAIAYGPLPMLLIGAGLMKFLPAVMPFAVTNPFAIAWPAAEVVAISVLLYLRWRQATRIEIVADDREEPSIGQR